MRLGFKTIADLTTGDLTLKKILTMLRPAIPKLLADETIPIDVRDAANTLINALDRWENPTL